MHVLNVINLFLIPPARSTFFKSSSASVIFCICISAEVQGGSTVQMNQVCVIDEYYHLQSPSFISYSSWKVPCE